ncbi:MAG: hypothetical protein MSG64_07040 [Pyrinomonadaceae bacterium MAG19_C2-C3]|nr:hypothetical protein [Pyrinomonadaceae bacterium MAG19_C2-C3]
MAIWQYDLHLIPRKAIEDLFSTVPPSLARKTFDEVAWWKNYQPVFDYESEIGSFLSPREFWSDEAKAWGEEDGTSIEVWFEQKLVTDIYVRINVASLDVNVLEKLTGLTARCEALFLTADLEVIEPDLQNLTAHIKQSNAFRFVENPEQFLSKNVDRLRVA